ncbi:hypothetical protein, partial [Streptomyces sp. XY152]|uniref:hypothetical protein n=1 Tax=Streptomyces sp. XY152 TaxID=1415560 RepID=UPI000B229E64
IREEEWDSVSPEVLDAIYEKREEYRDAPRFAVRVQIARQQMVWLQREKNRGSSYIANKVGATKHEVHNFRYHQRFLSLAVLKRIAGLYVAEGGPEVQVQQLDSQRSFPGGGGSDVRRLEEAVDDLTSKLGTLAALFKEIDADSDDDKKAIQDEEWHLVSPEVLGAIHEKREEYRDAPRYAVRVKVAQEQVAWLNREYPYSYIAGKVRATKDQLRHFKHGETFLPLAVLKRIADLYARERGLKLPGQRPGAAASLAAVFFGGDSGRAE